MPDIKAIIWDLDGTLYKFSKSYMDACDWAAAKAVVAAGALVTLKKAYDLSRESFQKYKMHGQIAIERYNLDDALYFKSYHDFLDEDAIDEMFNFETYFEQPPLIHAILTHNSHDWALRALKRIGLQNFFNDHHILGFEEYGFKNKSQNHDGFDAMLQRLNMPAANICFVEDSYKNLKTAKDKGMMTVLVTHGTETPHNVDFIDHIVVTPVEVFGLIKS